MKASTLTSTDWRMICASEGKTPIQREIDVVSSGTPDGSSPRSPIRSTKLLTILSPIELEAGGLLKNRASGNIWGGQIRRRSPMHQCLSSASTRDRSGPLAIGARFQSDITQPRQDCVKCGVPATTDALKICRSSLTHCHGPRRDRVDSDRSR